MDNPIIQALVGIIQKMRGNSGGQNTPQNQMQSTPPQSQIPMPEQLALLQILQKNTMAQTTYTPQAQQYLSQIPLEIMPQEDQSIDQHGTRQGSYYSNPNNRRIKINADLLKPGTRGGVEVLRHEYNHALDANLNPTGPMEPISQGPWTADSYGFFPDAKEYPLLAKSLSRFLNVYRENMPKTPHDQEWNDAWHQTQDVEGFAQYGARGQSALGGPMAQYYKGVFAPQNRPALNYSPAFLAGEYEDPTGRGSAPQE